MKITKEMIKAVMPNAERNIKANPHTKGESLDRFVDILNQYGTTFGLTTPMRWAYFLAQIAHESLELRYTEEIASGAAYDTGTLAIRLGNTPQKDGDGQRYKGRGYIQITGRSNYSDYGLYLRQHGMNVDLLKKPELLAQIIGATKSAMWFFWKNDLNRYADSADFRTLTRKVNGGYNGWESRCKYRDRALKTLVK